MADDNKRPRAFLCHGSDDKALARRIATDLQAAGIDTFFDEWEIRSGDSLRQKIDAGLATCTHFIALLTPNSIERPWVKTEMDAGFVKKVSGAAKFIALRAGLRASELPPLLQGLHSPEIGDYATDIEKLISDIYEVNKKPALGPTPSIARRALTGQTGLSPAAERVAEIFVRGSESGRSFDPQIGVAELRDATGLPDVNLIDAIDELEDQGMLKPERVIGAPPFGYHVVAADSCLFERLDEFVMGWDPEHDAVTIAARLASDAEQHGHATDTLMEEFGWTPRRMNPALHYLVARDLVMASKNMDRVFVTTHIFTTPKTRRFLREHA